MAKQTPWTKKAGVTPGKLVLIAVLGVVLVAVLYHQFAPTLPTAPNSPAPPAPVARAASRLRKATAADAKTTSVDQSPRKKTGAVATWQSPDPTSAVKYDPFALPASFPRPQQIDNEAGLAQAGDAQAEVAAAQQAALEAERTQSESQLLSLKQQGVRMVIKNDNTAVAMVGDKAVHVGDKVDGFTVIAIDSDGVTLAKDLNP